MARPQGKTLESSHEVLKIFEGHQDTVFSVAISPDEGAFASFSKGGTVLVRDINTGSQLADYSKSQATYTSLIFAPLEPLIAFPDDKVIKLWKWKTGETKFLKGHLEEVGPLAFSPDGKLIASGSSDKTMKLWDPNRGAILQTFNHPDRVECLVFSKNGELLGSTTRREVRIRKAGTWATVIIVTLEQEITSIAFTSEARLFAVGLRDLSESTTIKILETDSQREVKTLRYNEYSNSITGVAFAWDDKLIISGSVYGIIRLWLKSGL